MLRVKLLKSDQIMEGDEALIKEFNSLEGDKIWIDVTGDHIPSYLQQAFDLHELSLSDAKRLRHPPKVEQFPNYVYLLQRGIKVFDSDLTFEHVQISFFVGQQFLITFHQGHSLSVNEWWKSSQTLQFFSQSPILLTSRILNTMSSRYLEVMLEFESTLTQIEDDLEGALNDEVLTALTGYRARLRRLKRLFSYHEKTAMALLKVYRDADNDDERYYLQDVLDKNERISSLCQMYYELSGDLMDSFLSMASHKLNGTMRILTVITAIFVPLSFIVGLYGMNFEYIPELKFQYGYFVVVGFMLTLSISLISLFKFKKWL